MFQSESDVADRRSGTGTELAGVIENIRDYKEEPGTIICPDPEKAKEYKKRYELYKEIYEKTKQ